MGKLEKIKLKAAGIDIGSEKDFRWLLKDKKLRSFKYTLLPFLRTSSGVFTASWH